MAKRKVKETDFSKDGSHIAVVTSPANNQEEVTILKSKKVDLNKAEEVQVTTSMSTFLSTFFYMWREDANELAEILGYEPQEWMPELIGNDTQVELLKALDDNSTVSKELFENIESMSSEFNKLIKQKEEVMAKKKADTNVDLEKTVKDAVQAALKKQKEETDGLKTELQKAKDEAADLKKSAEKQEKDKMVELCKGYSFVEDADKLADSLFLCKSISGFDIILDTLEKAREAVKASLETEHGTDEEADLSKNKSENSDNVDKTTELLKKRSEKETK